MSEVHQVIKAFEDESGNEAETEFFWRSNEIINLEHLRTLDTFFSFHSKENKTLYTHARKHSPYTPIFSNSYSLIQVTFFDVDTVND